MFGRTRFPRGLRRMLAERSSPALKFFAGEVNGCSVAAATGSERQSGGPSSRDKSTLIFQRDRCARCPPALRSGARRGGVSLLHLPVQILQPPRIHKAGASGTKSAASDMLTATSHQRCSPPVTSFSLLARKPIYHPNFARIIRCKRQPDRGGWAREGGPSFVHSAATS